MTRTRIKICGVRDVRTALAAVEAGADAIGLVFAPRSPRHVDVETAQVITEALPPGVEPVGLFVDEPVERVRVIASEVGLRTVQLHGHEKPGDAAALAPLRIWKALAFDADRAQETLAPWRGASANLAALLFDTPPPHRDALPGGGGRRFDWNSLAQLAAAGELRGLPSLILAGGLTPDNVSAAIRAAAPYAVDVSSGVESERGVKDAAKIRAFCEAVRQADQVRDNE